jgi:hypothetical protein
MLTALALYGVQDQAKPALTVESSGSVIGECKFGNGETGLVFRVK